MELFSRRRWRLVPTLSVKQLYLRKTFNNKTVHEGHSTRYRFVNTTSLHILFNLSVWPDLAKFHLFCKIVNLLGKILIIIRAIFCSSKWPNIEKISNHLVTLDLMIDYLIKSIKISGFFPPWAVRSCRQDPQDQLQRRGLAEGPRLLPEVRSALRQPEMLRYILRVQVNDSLATSSHSHSLAEGNVRENNLRWNSLSILNIENKYRWDFQIFWPTIKRLLIGRLMYWFGPKLCHESK